MNMLRYLIVALAVLFAADTAYAASRFWVGGTGTWDASDTTHWAATSNGAGGQSVPGSSDTVTFDAMSGGGTVTVNTTVTVQQITMGAFTGTLDFSANNNNVTLSSGSNGLSNSGTGTRTLNLGNGTWTLQATSGNSWDFSTITNLTFNANSSTILFSGVGTSTRGFAGGAALSYNIVNFAGSGGFSVISAGGTIATLTIAAPNLVTFPSGSTTTITNAFTYTGSITGAIELISAGTTSNSTISIATGTPTCTWCIIRRMTFSGGATFSAPNSFDMGLNSGITITPPSAGAANTSVRPGIGQ